jgi:hypothetical protein
MQGCELLDSVSPDVFVLTTEQPAVPHPQASDEPRLRYDVESLQHWIDLNA